MKLHYLNKTTSHICPGPPLVIISLSTLFTHLCNPYLFLLPKFFHLTLSLTSSSLLVGIIIVFIILNICAPFYQNTGWLCGLWRWGLWTVSGFSLESSSCIDRTAIALKMPMASIFIFNDCQRVEWGIPVAYHPKVSIRVHSNHQKK